MLRSLVGSEMCIRDRKNCRGWADPRPLPTCGTSIPEVLGSNEAQCIGLGCDIGPVRCHSRGRYIQNISLRRESWQAVSQSKTDPSWTHRESSRMVSGQQCANAQHRRTTREQRTRIVSTHRRVLAQAVSLKPTNAMSTVEAMLLAWAASATLDHQPIVLPMKILGQPTQVGRRLGCKLRITSALGNLKLLT